MAEQQVSSAFATRQDAAPHEQMLRDTEEALRHGRSALLAIDKQDGACAPCTAPHACMHHGCRVT